MELRISLYKAPEPDGEAFNCPLCHVYSNQTWDWAHIKTGGGFENPGLKTARCVHCKKFSIWDRPGPKDSFLMVFPRTATAPAATEGMPENVADDFQEARRVLNDSPRAAAALLRLAIQKLCKQLGEPGENINDDIACLVKKGLPERIQKALDIVRVVGNNAVHPGQMDLNDDAAMASSLFDLVNMIVRVMIAEPKDIDELYEKLPESARKAVEKRDTGRPK